MTRKSKAKQERYTDTQRLDWLEQHGVKKMRGVQRHKIWMTDIGKWAVMDMRQEYTSTHDSLRGCIDAAIGSKLVRVRSKRQKPRGGK